MTLSAAVFHCHIN